MKTDVSSKSRPKSLKDNASAGKQATWVVSSTFMASIRKKLALRRHWQDLAARRRWQALAARRRWQALAIRRRWQALAIRRR